MYPNAPLPTLLDLHLFGAVFLCVLFLGVGGLCVVVFLRWGRVGPVSTFGTCALLFVACFFFFSWGVCTYLPLQGTPLPSGRLYVVCSAGADYLWLWDVSSLHWGQGELVSTLGMRVRRVVFLCVPLLQWMCAWEEGACVLSSCAVRGCLCLSLWGWCCLLVCARRGRAPLCCFLFSLVGCLHLPQSHPPPTPSVSRVCPGSFSCVFRCVCTFRALGWVSLSSSSVR